MNALDRAHELLNDARIDAGLIDARVFELLAERDSLRILAKHLSEALLRVRPLAGSEMFVHRCGDFYADPDYCGRLLDEMRAEHAELTKLKFRALKSNPAT